MIQAIFTVCLALFIVCLDLWDVCALTSHITTHNVTTIYIYIYIVLQIRGKHCVCVYMALNGMERQKLLKMYRAYFNAGQYILVAIRFEFSFYSKSLFKNSIRIISMVTHGMPDK